ncbi:MAG: glycosyltransferase family 39 protein [Phycisphaerales bacterium]|nr:MAG: glycosyltransferase family 39 protein [Phycisphaerales bacterium]
MIILRQPRIALLVPVGLIVIGYGLLSSLTWMKRGLAFLTYDGHVGQLSGGETWLLRILALVGGVLLLTCGLVWPTLLRAGKDGARCVRRWAAMLHPRACGQALSRVAAAHGRSYAVALVLVFTAGVAIRTAHIRQPIHDDESGAFFNWSHQPLYISFTTYGSPGNHILNTVLVAISYRLFGDSEIAIRLPALAAGLGLMAATFVLLLRMLGPWPALLALALLAGSDVCIEYSANARGYSLAALLGVWQTYVMLGGLQTSRWRPWVLASLLSALGIYVIPTMVYMTVALCAASAGIWWLERRRDVAWLLRPCIFGAMAVGIAAALYSPIVLVSGLESLAGGAVYEPLPLGLWLSRSSAITLKTLGMLGLGLMPAALLVVLVAVGFVSLRRVDPRWLVLWSSVLAAPALISLLQRLVPFARTFAYVQPFVYALVALGICDLLDTVARRWPSVRKLRPAAAPVLCGILLVGVSGKLDRAEEGFWGKVSFPAAEAAALLVAERFPTDVPVFALSPCQRPLQYHLDRIEGCQRHVGKQLPDAPMALWVRDSATHPLPSHRHDVDLLCRQYDVGPVLARLGTTEIVVLTNRSESSRESPIENISPRLEVGHDARPAAALP